MDDGHDQSVLRLQSIGDHLEDDDDLVDMPLSLNIDVAGHRNSEITEQAFETRHLDNYDVIISSTGRRNQQDFRTPIKNRGNMQLIK